MNNNVSESDHLWGVLKYRPEIDGLRALAVISVVMFHAELSFSGGYVGVDVFFVISGFLITSLIVRDIGAKKFTMLDFWERRVRRIFPALAFVVCACLIFGLGMMPQDFKNLGTSSIFQAIALSNVYFWKTSGYFDPGSQVRPLHHTWSLAVEEQFYIIFPIILVFLWRFRFFRSRLVLLVGMGVVSLMSLGLAAYFIPTKPNAVFFLLPSRIWELLVGSILALICPLMAPRRPWLRELFCCFGIAAILWPVFFYTQATSFPGLAAIPPVMGAALFIFGNSTRPRESIPLTIIGRVFASKPLVFVGLISYSLYLWHWPILVFGNYWYAGASPPSAVTAFLFVIMGGISVICWRYIEVPFRKKQFLSNRRALFSVAVAFSLTFIGVGLVLRQTNGISSRFSRLVQENAEAAEDLPQIKTGVAFGAKNTDSPKILLWGDSHANCTAVALELLCKEKGISAVYKHSQELLPPDVAAYMTKNNIPNILITNYWCPKKPIIGHPAEYWRKFLPQLVDEIDRAGFRSWVMLDVPDIDLEAPRVLSRAMIFGWEDDSWRRSVEEHHRRNRPLYQFATSGSPAIIIDPSPRFLDSTGKFYIAENRGVALYYDDDHITRKTSRDFIYPLLKEEMGERLLKTIVK